jgi:pimeloyl-ACP methyl ester carboxylesterase
VAADVAAALPESGTVQAIGFSMGARLLLEVAADHPDRFDRIVVAGIGAGVFESGSHEALAVAIEGGPSDDESHGTARLFAQFAAGSGNDPQALAAFLRRDAPALDPGRLAAIKCPVLVVLGDKDFAAPADPLVSALPNATFKSLPGVDHFATPKDFKFLDAALEFLGAAL